MTDAPTPASPERLLPLAGGVRERRDAARNRDALLRAASCLVARHGVEAVTMDAVAAEAGVGKGTVFRRFTSRAGLMAAVLDESESSFQEAAMSGPPPLGPGAPPRERLFAFGAARLESNLRHADLIRAAGGSQLPNGAVAAFDATHVRHLLAGLGVAGDLVLLAPALMAPLDIAVAGVQIAGGIPAERVLAVWIDLVSRVIDG